MDLGARGDGGPWDCAHQLGIGMGFVGLGPGRTVVASARIAEHARGKGGSGGARRRGRLPRVASGLVMAARRGPNWLNELLSDGFLSAVVIILFLKIIF